MGMNSDIGTLTDVAGVEVGHFSDKENGTGTTIIIFKDGAAGGVDARGLASGSRELLSLDPMHVTQACHALCLSGGSAFGLAAADGVMNYLAKREIGYFARVAYVPIVPTAIIFDLSFMNVDVRPDAAFGYKACENANDGPVEMGSVGAGTGATVGKIFGIDNAVKSGVGSSSIKMTDGVTVGALAVVNNLGDVIDYRTGQILAGSRDLKTGEFADTAKVLTGRPGMVAPPFGENTNLVAVVTDAKFDKVDSNKIARMASAGMARTLSPVHSTFDGDLVFAFSYGDKKSDVNRIGTQAAEMVAIAINRAVTESEGLGGIPSIKDLKK